MRVALTLPRNLQHITKNEHQHNTSYKMEQRSTFLNLLIEHWLFQHVYFAIDFVALTSLSVNFPLFKKGGIFTEKSLGTIL